MSNGIEVALLIGSLRRSSWTRKLAGAVTELVPASLSVREVPFRDLPLYDHDLEQSPPAPWLAFRERLRAANAVLFVTPEYNRSVPGGLKNALDVGSRPYGDSSWRGKPGAVISCSPGAIGGFGANHHLRQSLVFLDIPVMQQPEVYVGGVDRLFDDQDKLSNDATREFLSQFCMSFERWIRRNLP